MRSHRGAMAHELAAGRDTRAGLMLCTREWHFEHVWLLRAQPRSLKHQEKEWWPINSDCSSSLILTAPSRVWALASCVVACSCSLYSQSTSERARLLGAKCRVRTGHTELTMTNYLYGTRTRAPTEYRY